MKRIKKMNYDLFTTIEEAKSWVNKNSETPDSFAKWLNPKLNRITKLKN